MAESPEVRFFINVRYEVPEAAFDKGNYNEVYQTDEATETTPLTSAEVAALTPERMFAFDRRFYEHKDYGLEDLFDGLVPEKVTFEVVDG
jgi:hypothetical protein